MRSDRRETRLGLESTRWNKGSFELSAFSDASSSHSSSSSSSSSESSSIALSSLSSSSEDSKTSSSSHDLLRRVRDSTSSLKESCFLLLRGRLSPAVRVLCLAGDDMRLSKEPSFSSDEPPPSINVAPFLASLGLVGMVILVGIGAGARWVCDR